MATLSGAIAYRESLADAIHNVSNSWEMLEDHGSSRETPIAECPDCGERYVLVEGMNTSDDTQEKDRKFLLTGLASTHPNHPACIVVRDPNHILRDLCNQVSEALTRRAA
jgi:hypothetical protein